MKRSTSDKRIPALAGFLAFLLLWWLAAELVGERKMVLPDPGQTFVHMLGLLESGYTYRCIAATMARMLWGFGIALSIALVLGTLAADHPDLEAFLRPFLIVLRSVPTASLVYLFIVLAGFRKAPLILVTMIAFPIIYEGIRTGMANVDADIIAAARIDGSRFLAENLLIRLPLAAPYIISALAASFSLSFKIEIMAEVITGSGIPGLGCVIQGVRSADPTNMVPVFAYSLIAVLLMLMIDGVTALLLKRYGAN